MNPLQVSAQFAAFVWFTESNPQQPTSKAVEYARNNWIGFLASAKTGVGKLLIQMGTPPVNGISHEPRQRAEPRKSRTRQLAMAG